MVFSILDSIGNNHMEQVEKPEQTKIDRHRQNDGQETVYIGSNHNPFEPKLEF
jgi:hypothetical protein